MTNKHIMTKDEFIKALLEKYPQLEESWARGDDGEMHQVIKGIYLKPDTPAAKRLAATGKKYPTFKENREFEKWKAKKEVDDIERFANGEADD